MSVLDGPGEGTWSVFAQKVVEERDEARHALHEILAVIHRDGGHYTGKHGIAKSVEDAHAAWAAMMREMDKLRAERRQLRARLVECRPWVGVVPVPEYAGILRDARDPRPCG